MRSCGPAPVLMMESYSLEDSMGAGVRSHSRARDAFLPLTAIIKRKRRLDRRLVSEEKALAPWPHPSTPVWAHHKE